MVTLGHPVAFSRPWWRTLVRLSAATIAALALTGFAYEKYAARRDARVFPPPGRLIDVGGRRLHLLCIGSGRPTIFVEPGAFMNSASMSSVRREIAKSAQVCSYDRIGAGWSEPAPGTVSVGSLADDVVRLQDAAGLQPPFVIVASSMGGLVAEMVARRHPDRVAGLVMLDAATSDAIAAFDQRLQAVNVTLACVAANVSGSIGIVRFLDPFGFRSSRHEAAPRSAALMYRAQPWRTICSLAGNMRSSIDEFARVPALRSDLPLLVLSAERSANLLPPLLASRVDAESLSPLRREVHRTFARRSTRGAWRMVPGSDHVIANSQPQAVVSAVLEMLAQLR